jgi:uncharacterized protein DUF6541
LTTVATSFHARRASLVVPALVAAAPLALLLVRLAPAHDFGLALRLSVAAVCVLFVPGFLVVRLLGKPADPSLVVAAALAWSLVALFVALAATFAFNRSLVFTLAVLVGLCLASVVAGFARNRPVEAPGRAEVATVLGLLAAGLIVGAVVWWAAPPIEGDALYHLARARKLAQLPRLDSVGVSELFREGKLHPGYAFPLWHGALALVGRLAGVDSESVVSMLPALLTPLAFVVIYAAGAVLFRSRWGGIAVLAGQLAIFGLPLKGRPGLGIFETLSGPAHFALLVLVPAVLALVFAFVEHGGRRLLLSVGGAAFVLTVMHPPYGLFVALALGGFALTRLVFAPEARRDAVRYGSALGAVLVSAGLFLVWLLPTVAASASVTPDAAEKRRQLAAYAGQLDFFGESFRFAPSAISVGGAVTVAGLLAIPLGCLARRSRWSAFVLGSALPILALLLTPTLFTAFSDLATLSQARRLHGFLPLSFAFAGAAVLLGRLRIAGIIAAMTLGFVFESLYPGHASFREGPGGIEPFGGPAWPVWTAAIGAGMAFVVATAFRRRRGEAPEPSRWTAFAAVAFVIPVAVLSVPDVQVRDSKPILAPGFVRALQTEVEPRGVVFGLESVSYRVAAVAPVYVAAADAGHVWDRAAERIADVRRFYAPRTSDAERRRLLSKYEATWLIVNKRVPVPETFLRPLERVYDGQLYALYRLPSTRYAIAH